MAVLVPYVLFVLTAFYGLWLSRRQWDRCFPLLAIILSVNLIVAIYAGATRYGIPMLIGFIPFAALAFDEILDPTAGVACRKEPAA